MASQRPGGRRLRTRGGSIEPSSDAGSDDREAIVAESAGADEIDFDAREAAQSPARKRPGPGRPQRRVTGRPTSSRRETASGPTDTDTNGTPPTDPA